MSQTPNAKRAAKLVLLTHYFPAHRGGVEIVAYAVAKRLVEQFNFRIVWFASDVDNCPIEHENLEYVSVPSTNVIERLLNLPYPIWSLSIIPKLWRATCAADAVHIHDFIYCGSLLAFAIAKLQSKPVVFTQHVGFIPYKNRFLRAIQGCLNRILGAHVLRRASRVVFVSEMVRNDFSRFARFKRDSRLIPNGVDFNIYSPVSQAHRGRLRSDLGISDSSRVFLFVGRFVEKKGLAILRELVPIFPQVKWIVAGTGPLDPESWGFPNVTVYRTKQGAELADLYRVADLLILPSKGEGFPLVVQEAMACGTPALIGTETLGAVPGLEKYCFSADVQGSGVVVTWKETINSLLVREGRLREMRESVASFAHLTWSWDRCVLAYKEIFDELLPQ